MAAKDKYVAYVGTYTHENSVGIHVYDVDMNKGSLTERSVAPINNPSYLTISKDGRFLYSIEDEGVASFRITETGDLEKMNQSWIGGMRGCYVEVDSKGRYLFVGGYHDGRVTMMRLNEDGSIGDVADGIFHQGLGKSSAEKKLDPHVTCVILTPDEKYLCAVDYGLNQIKTYAIDYEHGKLHLADIIRCQLDSAPRMMRFSKDGKHAYILMELTNVMEVYTYQDTARGPEFEKVQEISVLKKENPVAASSSFEFTEDGKYIFVAIDAMNAVTYFERNPEDGTLTWMHNAAVSGDFPKTLAVLPGDEYYAVLNHDSNEIRTFIVDYKKKNCLMKNAPVKVDKPNCIKIHKL